VSAQLTEIRTEHLDLLNARVLGVWWPKGTLHRDNIRNGSQLLGAALKDSHGTGCVRLDLSSQSATVELRTSVSGSGSFGVDSRPGFRDPHRPGAQYHANWGLIHAETQNILGWSGSGIRVEGCSISADDIGERGTATAGANRPDANPAWCEGGACTRSFYDYIEADLTISSPKQTTSGRTRAIRTARTSIVTGRAIPTTSTATVTP
jgi:hypothetical protein